MEMLNLRQTVEFAPDHHVYTFLAETPFCSISVVGWEPGQTSPIHSHPTADEIYHVIEGEGVFSDGRHEMRLRPGDTVIFPAGEVHQVSSITRMVLPRPGRRRPPPRVRGGLAEASVGGRLSRRVNP